MRSIKFSHRYKKMPPGVEFLDTFIKNVSVISYEGLSEEDIKNDTETVDGTFYNLPRGFLIHIKLWSDALPDPVEWGTMRPYNEEKFDYYKSLIGQQVKIEILIK